MPYQYDQVDEIKNQPMCMREVNSQQIIAQVCTSYVPENIHRGNQESVAATLHIFHHDVNLASGWCTYCYVRVWYQVHISGPGTRYQLAGTPSTVKNTCTYTGILWQQDRREERAVW